MTLHFIDWGKKKYYDYVYEFCSRGKGSKEKLFREYLKARLTQYDMV